MDGPAFLAPQSRAHPCALSAWRSEEEGLWRGVLCPVFASFKAVSCACRRPSHFSLARPREKQPKEKATPVGAFRPSMDGTSVKLCRAFRAGSGNRSCVASTPASMPSPARAKRHRHPCRCPLRGLIVPASPPPRGPGKAGARPAHQKPVRRHVSLPSRGPVHRAYRRFWSDKTYAPVLHDMHTSMSSITDPKIRPKPFSAQRISALDAGASAMEHGLHMPRSGVY